jgi:hypothetical protein
MRFTPQRECELTGCQKFCSRKARKFESQGQKLFLPGLELAYVFGALTHTPRGLLLGKHLPRIDRMLGKLDKVSPEDYGTGSEYWDGEPDR